MYWLPRTALTRFSVAWYLRANAQARRPRRLAAWPPAQSCRPSCRRSTGNRSPYVSMTPSWALRFGRRGAFLCALLCGSGCCPDSLWAWGGYQLQRCHLPPQPSRCELLFIAYTPCASAHSGSRTTAPQTKRPVSRFKKRRSRGCNRSPFSHFVLIFYIVFSVDVLLANCRCRCPRPKSTTTSPTTTTTVRWTRARPRARWVIPRASGPRAAPSRWVTSWTGATHNHKRYPHLLCVPRATGTLRSKLHSRVSRVDFVWATSLPCFDHLYCACFFLQHQPSVWIPVKHRPAASEQQRTREITAARLQVRRAEPLPCKHENTSPHSRVVLCSPGDALCRCKQPQTCQSPCFLSEAVLQIHCARSLCSSALFALVAIC